VIAATSSCYSLLVFFFRLQKNISSISVFIVFSLLITSSIIYSVIHMYNLNYFFSRFNY